MQLANRSGPMNEIEYSEFVQKVQAFADAIGASPDFPDMLEAVPPRANSITSPASTMRSSRCTCMRAAPRGASATSSSTRAHHGFVPGVVPGRLVLPSAEEGAPPVLTLTFDSQAALADDPNIAAVRDVTLSFDVPQTEASLEPFAAWQAARMRWRPRWTRRSSTTTAGRSAPKASRRSARSWAALYEQLEGRELAAGSAAARRLFS